ncbi:MAG: tyrosine-type recombinase/integrase [Thaumarchaeota archaeon]|nr:tyrosine-type recombinase/integrase [Nitrososphaerota archaeon]
MAFREGHDIHGYAERVEQYLALIARSEIPDEDKKALTEFSEVLRAQGLTLGRVMKYLYHLRVCAQSVAELSQGTSLRSADARTITKLAAWINGSPRFKPETRKDFNVVLKRFFQWLRAPPEEYPRWRRKHIYPLEVEDLPTVLKRNVTKLPSDLLNEEDVRKILGATDHPMLAAFVAFLDEIGAREGEALSMTIGSVIFDGTDAICKLRGKTGERQIYLVKSVSMLSRWLDLHPFREEPKAALWLNLSNNRRHEPWNCRACEWALANLAKKGGVKKRVYPYLFRHSAATRDARLGFTESQLCLKYGWVLGSRMPRIYLHLAGTDLRQKIMEVYGGNEVERPKPQTLRCPRCSAPNHPSQKYCFA